MPEIPDVATLTTISSNWGNMIRSRTVQRYSSVANRTSEHSSPSEGDLSYLEDSNSVWVYDGSSWLLLGPNLEVDDHVEVATDVPITQTFVAYATVNLTIPATWASWKCMAYATCSLEVPVEAAWLRIRIDGTDQAVQVSDSDTHFSGSVAGRRTGMTTTGSRAIELRAARTTATAGARIRDIFLYARAVRTS